MPIEWKELGRIKSASQFLMKDVLKRVKGKRPSAVLSGQPLPKVAAP
jgi:DNA primase